jgi:hypothetical protein
MPFPPDALQLTLLLLVAANVIGLVAYVLSAKRRVRHQKSKTAAISASIAEYFRKSGVEVVVDCTSVLQNDRFTAFIESEPMKRFRLSHIIEMTVRDHVRKTCDLELEKIYWRFPIKEGQRAAMDEAKPDQNSDEYINEGLDHYRHIPQSEVTELPWEQFEEVVTIDRHKTATQETRRNEQT